MEIAEQESRLATRDEVLALLHSTLDETSAADYQRVCLAPSAVSETART